MEWNLEEDHTVSSEYQCPIPGIELIFLGHPALYLHLDVVGPQRRIVCHGICRSGCNIPGRWYSVAHSGCQQIDDDRRAVGSVVVLVTPAIEILVAFECFLLENVILIEQLENISRELILSPKAKGKYAESAGS